MYVKKLPFLFGGLKKHEFDQIRKDRKERIYAGILG